jgi:DNA-binding ferritin-like protein
MSDDKGRVSDKASEIAKNIWLAGVGAYGRAVDEAQGRLEKAGVEPPKLFKDLVKAGAALEEEARDAGHSARHSVEDRINRVRDNFSLQRPVRGEDLLALHEKIDRLTNKVDALSEALAASGAVKAPRKKTTQRKKAPASKAAAGKKAPAASRQTGSRKTGSRKTGSRANAPAKPGKGGSGSGSARGR